MSENCDPYHPDLAEEFLKVAEWTYGSVAGYQDSWSQIHPQDQADWLQSFRQIAEDLKQLGLWRKQKKLSPTQLERFLALEEQQKSAQPILDRLGKRPMFPYSEPRVPSGHRMVLDV
ncbi:MAG TPA: hypothetical protein V6C82_03115 [Chroococcales cyanobacterium]|jgi:hypothetical protein